MVSIIVPVYNTAAYLKECIHSIRSQSYADLEIILVDDGSTDHSLSICLEAAKQDERIIVLDKENGGQASARNLGLDIAKGDYIAFVDSDDTISPDLIAENIKLFEQDPMIEVVQFPIYRNYGLPTAFKDIARTGLIEGLEELYRQWIEKDRISWIVCNKIFKKEVFAGLRFKEGMVYEDNDMVTEVLSVIQKLYISDAGMYYYHSRDNSTTTSAHTLKKEQDTQKVSFNIYQKLLLHPLLKQGRVIMESRILNVALSIQKNYGEQAIGYLPSGFRQRINLKDVQASHLPAKEKIKLYLLKILGVPSFIKIFAR
ncbi:hypothetical protein DBR32_03755 [Taibaiella sp. KBW10]|uniref:glycosyltransferase family 2 protein n=1 Tax=Taibaiella sp. KBW10 TaxID=2153357 RepID=UPI000F5A3481|nr:glycosyltransferase family 2 protein [Taibaiella sp. KBW10]RQO31931.1 hypothetical protein DBR32_03755 [Taibaiella sp. KBW10]